MPINYPNGKRFNSIKQSPITPKTEEKRSNTEHVKSAFNTYSGRGQTLEEDINESNEYYLLRGMANIHKKPTPIQIVKVDYPARSAAKIKEAYFKTPSTTDYNGVYQGKYIDFEAKETKNKTSFPLSNIHEHQITHLKAVRKQKGIGFFIIRFTTLDKTYILNSEYVFHFWDNKEKERKSIPLTFFEQNGIEIPLGLHPRVPYLEAIDELIKKMV
ncbi:Holliday junction resolvase RecU [Priestia filamentosa]|uniref:Holliday junction resolvase RecU n=1 Tax=Priestia filamentosa TaxID=1402861 RepID=UPI0039791F23